MLIARADSGDVTVFLALVNRIAEALADDGDEDPVGARRAKAIGIAGYPDRALDLLLRHRHDPDTHQHPEERQAADADRPWPIRPIRGRPNPPRPAGQPSSTATTTNRPRRSRRRIISIADRTGAQSTTKPSRSARIRWMRRTGTGSAGNSTPPRPSAPRAHRRAESRTRACRRARRSAPVGDGGTAVGINLPAALAAFSKLDAATLETSLAKARPHVVIHLHVTDEAVTTGRGVVRTDQGPITVEQLRRFLGDTGGDLTVRPVLDPASVAAVDSYEIPLALRRAMAIRTPASVFPYSPTLTGVDRISGDSNRTDLDHTILTGAAGHPARPEPGSSVRWPAANTAPEPSASGRFDNPTPAPMCGEHPKAGWPSPPTKAPSSSATVRGRRPSGTPPNPPSRPPPDPANDRD